MIDPHAAAPPGKPPQCFACNVTMAWRRGEYVCVVCGMRETTIGAGFGTTRRDDPQFTARAAADAGLRKPLPPPDKPKTTVEVGGMYSTPAPPKNKTTAELIRERREPVKVTITVPKRPRSAPAHLHRRPQPPPPAPVAPTPTRKPVKVALTALVEREQEDWVRAQPEGISVTVRAALALYIATRTTGYRPPP